MSGEPIRFVHTADLHLERPMSGVSRIPEDLRAPLIDAPFTAAQRVFETARLEQVDFLVLSGDILHPLESGSSSLCFLLEQFELLAEARIPVYWSGGRVDRFHQWPKAASLPEGVYRSASREVRSQPFYRDGKVAALLQISGYQGRGDIDVDLLATESREVPVIAVAYGDLKSGKLDNAPVNYWAMGGRHASCTELHGQVVVHYPGTPQGRSPEETGPHGCTLVQMDSAGQVETEFIECDAIQLTRREIRLTAGGSRRKLERNLVDLTKDFLAQENNQPRLLNWAISGTDRASWASPSTAEEILLMLRKRFESSVRELWITGLQFLYPETFPQPAIETETIAGDFFEIVHEMRTAKHWPQVLVDQLEDHPLVQDILGKQLLRTKAEREALLRQVVHFGLDLLGAQQAQADSPVTDSERLREAS